MMSMVEIVNMLGGGLSDRYQRQSRTTSVYFDNLGPPPSVWPHLFCSAGHEKRRGEQLKW